MNEPRTGSDHAKTIRYIVLSAAAVSLSLEFIFWAAFLLSSLRYRTDFRQLYVAGYMARTGHLHQLYDVGLQQSLQNELVSPGTGVLPFIRPSYAALLYAPLSLLPYSYAYFIWLGVNLLLLSFVARLLRAAPHMHLENSFVLTAAFAFLPVQIGLMQGQDSALLLILFTSAFLFLAEERDFIAGVLLALGLFKFQLVLPVAGLFLLKRRWNFMAGFSWMAALISATCASLVGLSQVRAYLGLINIAASGYQESFGHQVSWTKMANLEGLAFGLAGSLVSARTLHVSVIVASATVFATVFFVTPKDTSATQLFVIALVTTLVATPYLYAHDLTLFVLPLVIFLGSRARADQSLWLCYSAAAVFCAVLLHFLTPNHFYLVALVLMQFLFALVWSTRRGGVRVAEAHA